MFDLRLPFSSIKLFREDMRPYRCTKFPQRMQVESGRCQHDSLCSVDVLVMCFTSLLLAADSHSGTSPWPCPPPGDWYSKPSRREDAFVVRIGMGLLTSANNAQPAGTETQSGRLHQFCPVILGSPESSRPESFCCNSGPSQREDVLVGVLQRETLCGGSFAAACLMSHQSGPTCTLTCLSCVEVFFFMNLL